MLDLGPRHGGEQRARVRVERAFEQDLAGSDLHEPSRAHDRDAIRHVVHHREVVGDEEIGEAELALEVLQEVQYLGLHGDVEGRHRLVADEELGLQGERTRDADALALSAGEAVRIAAEPPGVEPGQGHEPLHLRDPGRAVADPVNHERFTHDVEDRHARVEGAERVLKDELDPRPEADELAVVETVEPHQGPVVVEDDRAFVRVHRAHDHLAHGGLAAPALPDETKAFPPVDPEAHPVDRRAGLARGRPGAAGFGRPRPAGRRPRPPVHERRRLTSPGRPVRSPGRPPGETREAAHEPEPGARGVLLADVLELEEGEVRNARRRLSRARAAVRERAPLPPHVDVSDRGQPLAAVHSHSRHGPHQGLEIGVARVPEEVLDGAPLHQPPVVDHHHVVREARHHPEVVGDEEERHVELRLEVAHEFQGARLHDDVERGGRFVGDEQDGPAHEGHRDHRSLAKPPRELERIGVERAGRIGEADQIQHLAHRLPPLGPGAVAAVQAKRLHDLVADRMERRERGHRLLEDDGDPPAPERSVRGRIRVQAREVEGRLAEPPRGVGEQDLPADHMGAPREDPEHRLGDDRLPGARFADQGHRAAGRHVERHPLDRVHGPLLPEPELHLEVADGQERRRGGRPGPGHAGRRARGDALREIGEVGIRHRRSGRAGRGPRTAPRRGHRRPGRVRPPRSSPG